MLRALLAWTLLAATARAGEYFGELAAIDRQPRSASVVVSEDTLLAVMPADCFLDLLQRRVQVTFRVLHRLTHMVRTGDVRIMELSTLAASQRVYSEILRLAQPEPAVPGYDQAPAQQPAYAEPQPGETYGAVEPPPAAAVEPSLTFQAEPPLFEKAPGAEPQYYESIPEPYQPPRAESVEPAYEAAPAEPQAYVPPIHLEGGEPAREEEPAFFSPGEGPGVSARPPLAAACGWCSRTWPTTSRCRSSR